jgi:hypothetical protein
VDLPVHGATYVSVYVSKVTQILYSAFSPDDDSVILLYAALTETVLPPYVKSALRGTPNSLFGANYIAHEFLSVALQFPSLESGYPLLYITIPIYVSLTQTYEIMECCISKQWPPIKFDSLSNVNISTVPPEPSTAVFTRSSSPVTPTAVAIYN